MNKDNEEWFDIVNKEGKRIGKASRTECHSGTKLLHPVVHVHVVDRQGRLLLQERSITKKIQPGKWDTSVGGHIMAGENLEDALRRETLEELGLQLDMQKVEEITSYIYESEVEKEYIHSFLYRADGPFSYQEEEIDSIAFYTMPALEKLINEDKTTPNFNYEFTNYIKKYIINENIE